MSRQITKNLTVKDLILIILGSTILSISVKYIFDPIGLVTGGVSGLSIVIRHVSEQAGVYVIPLWLGNLVLNLPIFLFAWKTEGFRSIMRTSISGYMILRGIPGNPAPDPRSSILVTFFISKYPAIIRLSAKCFSRASRKSVILVRFITLFFSTSIS